MVGKILNLLTGGTVEDNAALGRGPGRDSDTDSDRLPENESGTSSGVCEWIPGAKIR